MSKKKKFHQAKIVGPDGHIVTTMVEEESDEDTAIEEAKEIMKAIESRSEDTGINVNEIMEEIVPEEEEVKEVHVEKAIPPTYQHMYRVRLEWDKPDTQIFSSPDLEAARVEAKSHDGYKIFVDDDGEMIEDPWAYRHEESTPVKDEPVPVRHPIPGKSITLVDELLYRTAEDKVSCRKISGTFYYYDNSISCGKAKIMDQNYDFTKIRKNPNLILGYIKV